MRNDHPWPSGRPAVHARRELAARLDTDLSVAADGRLLTNARSFPIRSSK